MLVLAVVAATSGRFLSSLPRRLSRHRAAVTRGVSSHVHQQAVRSCGHRRALAASQQLRQLQRRCLSSSNQQQEVDDIDKPDWQFEQPPMERPQAPLPGFDHPPSDKVMDLCDRLTALNMIDLKQFINLYQKKTGITEDMVSANMLGGGGGGGGGGGAAAAAAAPVEEKSVFDVKLVSFDAKAKIKVRCKCCC
eukprot:TRINITY_DN506_c0_g1_i1.p2 TRINITY_DN506_c0_g1~~TRINITY_DN506_c0_g1_i1.p2  ORF type:complete len:193 (-),score=61.06 TRINITY_DN506_c0_g1_i1:1670-2248(-)